jgi:plasmid stabilization system protein ParE
MRSFRVQEAAADRLEEIHRRTRDRWEADQADAYVAGMFEAFAKIAAGRFPSRPIPAEFGVEGYVSRHGEHFIYWKTLSDGDIGVVTVLHERMHRIGPFKDDLGG